MKRIIYKTIYKIAGRIHHEQLKTWAYMKWLNTYMNEPFGYWKFAGEFLGCEFTEDDLSIEV